MKRELAFVLEVQSQFSRSLGRTRATKVRTSPCNGCSESVSHKRFKRFEANESSSDWRDGVVESVIEEELKCDLVKSVCEEEVKNELAQPQIKEEPKDGMEEGTIKEGGPIVIGESSEKPRRRFTRSALKPKVEPMDVSVPVTGSSEAGNGEAVSKVDEKATTAVSVSRTPKKNLELKMSKKIALNKIPLTVKELLETGMLEGYPVVYGGGTKTSGLRGTIKDLGILCSCFSCKGCRVVAPSQFERHACKSYRRAAQYIYLENGNNFLKVLKACKDAPLDTLEATIQSAIGPFPVKKSIMCQNCKGSLPPSCATKIGPLCNSCMESKKSQASPTHTTIRRARSSTPVLIKKSSKTASACTSSQNKSRGKITKKHQQLHRLVFEEGGLPDGTEVAYYARGQKLLEGYKKGFGIFCRCCQSEVSPSLFEAHAGWASRKKPYSNIYTSNGVSLHELSISLSKGRKYSAKDSDDLCIICADGGNLLLCDGCPRVFHKECASLSSIPRGDWYCQYCQNVFRRERFVEHNANAVAAGRVSGVDAIEQITKRCIRIVKNLEAEVSGCVLCRGGGFSKSGFGPRTVILCDQCEKEFHVGCLKDHKMADLKELPKGKWFCCMDCRRIHSTLQKLLVRGAEKLPDSLLNVIKKKHEEKAHEEKGSNTFTNFDVRWRLLSGKIASPETRSLLSKAVAIFHDCFDPIIDSTTGRDLIPSMVYGRNTRGQEFGGMYCAVLTVNESVVSAGILRVFGREGAELPLVATSNDNHGKGYFQTLFSCIEKLLAFLNVRSIFLPAAEEAESIWSEKFGFKKIKPDQLSNFRKNCCQMMTFQGTSMLQKMVPECRIIHKNIE